jgi:hypothetical protein
MNPCCSKQINPILFNSLNKANLSVYKDLAAGRQNEGEAENGIRFNAHPLVRAIDGDPMKAGQKNTPADYPYLRAYEIYS